MSKKAKVTTIPIEGGSSRMPTGAMQFKDDWPGLFIRGDDAFSILLDLRSVQKTLQEECNGASLPHSLLDLIEMIEQDVIVKGGAK